MSERTFFQLNKLSPNRGGMCDLLRSGSEKMRDSLVVDAEVEESVVCDLGRFLGTAEDFPTPVG